MTSQGLFGSQAGDYRAFRPLWPEEVFARIRARTSGRRTRAVDLGAGTGLTALSLAADYPEVVAVEPDERMLAQMEPRRGVRKLHARAEDADFEPGSVDLVTAGNSFHWMEGEALCERAHAWLRPGGVLAVFRYNPPHAAHGPLEELLDHEYAVVWRAHVHPRLRDLDYTRRTLERSRFGPRLETSWLPNDLILTLAELIGFLRSTSYAGGHARSLPDPERYWRELGERARAKAGPGPFVLDFGVELCLAIRD